MTSAERIARGLIGKIGVDRAVFLAPILVEASIGNDKIHRTFVRMERMLRSPYAHGLVESNADNAERAMGTEMTTRTLRGSGGLPPGSESDRPRGC